MGTEILLPRDFPIRPTQDLSPLRRFSPIHHHNNRKPPAMEKRRRRRESSPRTGKQQRHEKRLEMGQVTILKRGETLEGTVKGKVEGPSGVVDRTCEEAWLPTERLGPDPEVIPRRIRLVLRHEEEYAGSEFSSSPSPRSLPLPSFSRKGIAEAAAVDLSATVGLLRLLRLEE